MEEVIEKLKVLPKKSRKRKIVSNYYLNPLVPDVQALKGQTYNCKRKEIILFYEKYFHKKMSTPIAKEEKPCFFCEKWFLQKLWTPIQRSNNNCI